MDAIDTLQRAVKRIICEYAALKPSYGTVDVETILDDENGHYELLHIGWDQWKRIHGCVIHIDVREDKIYIQHDGTEEGIADELIALGIPKDAIVLAFKHPDIRELVSYTAA